MGVILMLPSLFLGWFADDWILLHDLRAGGGGLRAAAQLYQFSRWWPKIGVWFASPEYRTDFLRPLGGLLFALDARLGPFLGHVQSLGWWALLLGIVAALYRRLLPPRVAALALVLFAVSPAHWMPVAWLANRHALVATTLVLAGIVEHLKWRDGQRRGLWLSLLAFTIGLSASEAAVQALVYLFVLEVALPGRRLYRLAPASGLLVAYGLLRRPLGAAVAGSGIYFDPLAHPLRFAAALPARMAVLLGDLLGGAPSDLWFALPKGGSLLPAVGVAVIAVFIWITWRAKPSRIVVALLVGGVLALVPGAAGVPGSRLLFASSFGSAALVATLLQTPSPVRVWLLFVHVLAAPLVVVVDQTQAMAVSHRMERMMAASDLDGEVVVVTAPDAFLAIYPPYLAHYRSYRVLAFTPHDLVLSRPAERALRLSANGPLFDSAVERMLRDRPLQVGERIRMGTLEARYESLAALSFSFDEPLESLEFVSWHDGALRRVTLPPVGGQVTISREPGMMGL